VRVREECEEEAQAGGGGRRMQAPPSVVLVEGGRPAWYARCARDRGRPEHLVQPRPEGCPEEHPTEAVVWCGPHLR